MAEEQSIKDQIAAMEGWAIEVLNNKLSFLNYKDAKPLLKNIDRQGRKLEWRGYGIKGLPDIFTKDLKTQISSARASAEKLMGLLPKIKTSEVHLKLCKQYATSMVEMLKRARAVVDNEPWEPVNFPKYKTEKWFASLFEQVAKRKGYYKRYSKDYLLRKVDLSGAQLMKANLKGANLEGANLEGADLRRANLRTVNLKGANLREADLTETDLTEANFWEANLSGAIFVEAYLYGAHLLGANLEGANLWKADLLGANLREADLTKANLEGANLWGADLTKANLWGADLTEAKLEGANLTEANLEGARGLTLTQLHSAKNWEKALNIPPDLK